MMNSPVMWKLRVFALLLTFLPGLDRLLIHGLVAAQVEAKTTDLKKLAPPADQVELFALRAEGVQMYEWRARKDHADQFEWALKAPRAKLFDMDGEEVGTHTFVTTPKGPRPIWEMKEGSKIVAEKKEGAKAPDSHAVDWLLLKVPTPEEKGTFVKVTYIQRVDTWAGQPPAKGPPDNKVGTTVERKYQATYRFFGPKP
jgi:hypothetical protein